MTPLLSKLFLLSGACLAILFLPGCWDYQRINDRAEIIGIGVDPAKHSTSQLSYTFQVPLFGQSSGGTPSGAAASNKFLDFTVAAQGMADAIAKAQLTYNRVFYLGNLECIILNECLDQEQIKRVVSEVMRDPSTDKTSYLLFSSQPTVKLFSLHGEEPTAESINRFFMIGAKQNGYTVRMRLWQFWTIQHAVGHDLSAGLIRIENGSLQIYGLLPFRGNRPLAEVSANDALYYNLMNASSDHAAVFVKDEHKSFEMGDLHGHSHISTSLKGGVATLHADVRLDGIVLQDETHGDQILTDAEMRRYEKVAARDLQRRCGRVLHALQQERSDIYGFGYYLVVHDPRTKEYVSDQWPEVFAHAKTDVQIHVSLGRKGNIM